MPRPVLLLAPLLTLALLAGAQDRLMFHGKSGPGRGKRVALISGDDEYRSEQALPQLARILAERHGFDCTVLFSIDADGTINPERHDNIPGLETLDSADLMVLMTRFRDLPDAQMKHIVDYVESGRPIIGVRTATHAFDIKTSPTYRRWTWNSKEWDGGFGRQVLGETWIDHHGKHKVQSTRGIVVKGQERHPILRGIASGQPLAAGQPAMDAQGKRGPSAQQESAAVEVSRDVWVPTDVYRVRLPLTGDAQPLLLGAVLESMEPSAAAVVGPQNDPMMPVAWTRTYRGGRVFTTTMGSAQDLLNEAFRRLLVNACYWAVGLERRIPSQADVRLVGAYDPLPFGFGGYQKGLKVQ